MKQALLSSGIASAAMLAAVGCSIEPRGIFKVSAETASPEALLADLTTAFSAFQADRTARDSTEEAARAEQAQEFQATIDALQSAIDAQAAQMDRLSVGGSGGDGVDALTPEQEAYHAAYSDFVRTGRGETELRALAVAAGGEQAALELSVRSAASVGSDEQGGFLAPIEWDRTITNARIVQSEMRAYSSQQTVTGQGFSKLFNVNGAGSGWVGETEDRPETDSPVFRSYSYVFGEIYANPGATQHMLEDPEVDFAAWLGAEVDDEFAMQEGAAFVTGDGINKPRGVLTFDAATEAALAADKRHPLGPIKEVVSGDANLLTVDGLIELVYDLETKRSQGAAFYMNRKTLAVVRKMKDADGNLIWRAGLESGQPATLLGHPVYELSDMPDVAAGSVPVIFGNMKMLYRVFDRVGVSILRDPFTKKPYVLFYTRKRVGGGCWNPQWGRLLRVGA